MDVCRTTTPRELKLPTGNAGSATPSAVDDVHMVRCHAVEHMVDAGTQDPAQISQLIREQMAAQQQMATNVQPIGA
jgi:hypothetical protein